IVKDPRDHRTLWRADFDKAIVARIVDLFDEHEQPAVTFTDRSLDEADFIIPRFPTGRRFFDEYVDLNREHAEIEADCAAILRLSEPESARQEGCLFHVCAIGSRLEMLAFQRAAHERMNGQVQTFVQRSPRYLGTMCEILRSDASKWSAILHIARLWNV